MKRVILANIFALGILFTSCSKDEGSSEPETQESTIVGTWFLTSLSEDGADEELSACQLMSNFVFDADGHLRDNDFYLDSQLGCINDGLPGTYIISGENITIQFFEETDPTVVVDMITYSFNINDNTLSLAESDDYILTYTKEE